MSIPKNMEELTNSARKGTYSGVGSLNNTAGVTNNWTSGNVFSGPDWIEKITNNLKDKSVQTWYALDLCGKYNKDSRLKKYHLLTFYFRHENNCTNKLEDSLKGATQGKIITCALPESFTYSFGGEWGKPFDFGGSDLLGGAITNLSRGAQSLSFAINNALTWKNAKTMSMVFKIPVFDDVGTGTRVNYQEALELFAEAALPSLDRNGIYESIPGPNIVNSLNLGSAYNQWKNEGSKYQVKGLETANWVADTVAKTFVNSGNGATTLWDRISIQVGGLLLLDYCVIKDVKVTFPNTKAMIMHNYMGTTKSDNLQIHLQPQLCELEVTVETAIGMDRNNFKQMLQLREQISSNGDGVGGNDMFGGENYVSASDIGKQSITNESIGVSTGITTAPTFENSLKQRTELTNFVRLQDIGGMSTIDGGIKPGILQSIVPL